MITSINSDNSLEYRGLFEEATADLKEYAQGLLADIEAGENKELLLLFINRFPGGKDYNEENIKENLTAELIDEIVKISTLNDYFCNIKELIEKTGKGEYVITKDTMFNNNKNYYIYNFEKNEYQSYEGTQFLPDNIYYEKIYKPNSKYVALSLDEPRFKIDANTRAISIPTEFKKNGVGVQGDHTAETIYFVIDRYFDTIDLAADDIFIAIQYEGPTKDIYGLDSAVFKDVATLQNKIIFGWVIDDKITAVPGNIKFAVHFFKGELDENNKIKAVKYSFNTLTAQITINKAFEFDLSSFDAQKDPSQLVIDRLTNSKADGAIEALAPIFVVNLPQGKVDLNTPDRIDTDETTYTFDALGHSPDAGFIEYTWYRKDGDVIEEVPAEKVSMRYVPTADTTPALNKIYYYKDVEGDWARLAEDTFQIGVDYFERRSCCVVDYVGTYYVAIKNNVGTSSVIVESNRVEVPRPTMPKSDTIEIDEYDILKKYGWDIEVGYVRATVGVEEGQTERTLKITAEANEGDTIQYQWHKVEGVDEHYKEKPDLNAEGVYIDRDGIEGATDKEYTTGETGWYTVDIIGTRNNAEVIFPSEIYYRLTSMPERPKFIEAEGIVEEDVYLPLGQYVSVVIDKLDYTDEVKYHWYKDVEPYGADEDVNDVLLEEFEGATEIKKKDLSRYIGDVLYCKAVNIYNKVEATSAPSRRFFIMNSQADKPEIKEE